MQISIVIPTLDEEAIIRGTIRSVRERSAGYLREIIVADAGSNDSTEQIARDEKVTVVTCSKKGRARQMNTGAGAAASKILFFLHADSVPPPDFDRSIIRAVEAGNVAGCFQLSFDDSHPLLKCYGWFTQFDIDAFRFGDQGLFITKAAFKGVGGFDDRLILMEDNEIVRRIRQHYSFKVLNGRVVTSARKYRENGILRLQLIYFLIYVLYHMGFSQDLLVRVYKKFIM